MANDEQKNAFERKAAQPSLQDDRKNKFLRHQGVVEAQRRNTTAHDNRIAKHEQDNARWTKQTFQPTAAGGTALPPELVALKVASDADRTARRNATSVVIPPISTIIAVIEKWQREQAHYFESAWNYNCLVNDVVTEIANGRLTLSVEAIANRYVRLLQNNNLETAPDEYFDAKINAIVRARGTVQRPAPVMVPRHVWPAEEAAAREEEISRAITSRLAEDAENNKKPFAQLKKEATKDFKPPKPGGPSL